jgi:hypothetical protein
MNEKDARGMIESSIPNDLWNAAFKHGIWIGPKSADYFSEGTEGVKSVAIGIQENGRNIYGLALYYTENGALAELYFHPSTQSLAEMDQNRIRLDPHNPEENARRVRGSLEAQGLRF